MHELAKLKGLVYEQHMRIYENGLVILSEGNVSQITPDRKYVIIKPSGVLYNELTPEKMVVVDMKGRVYEGLLKPSVDTPIHLEIYRCQPEIRAVVHTHAVYATAWAQAKEELPCLGTTHADRFNGPVPVTRDLTPAEIAEDYAGNLAKSIVEVLRLDIPAVLAAGHGPFAVDTLSASEAVDTMIILDKVARLALLKQPEKELNKPLFRSHYERKYGVSRHYGQG